MQRTGYNTIKHLCVAAMVAVPMLASAYTFTQPFSYFANRHSLSQVLTSFAKSQGLKVEIADDVKGKVSGRFRDISAEEFLSAMADAYDVGYYVMGNEIYFFNLSKTTKDFLTVRRGEGQSLIDSLRSAGLIATELPLSINSLGTMITIEGPEQYVEQVKRAATAYESVLSEKVSMRVFKLKHAWADDVELTSMDKTIKVPGVASVLRALVMGQTLEGQSTVTKKDRRADKMEKMGVEGLSKGGKKSDNPITDTKNTPIAAGSISIMADTRLNAVLVSDASYRMPYYEQVINDLDKPVELVEIHAAIVDINAGVSRELGVNLGGTTKKGNWTSRGTIGEAKSGYNASDYQQSTDKDTGKITYGDLIPGVGTLVGSAGSLLSTVYEHGSDIFMAKISALEESNKARILGRPSVLTVDNVQASLENTTTYYVKLEGTEAVDLVKVEAGTVLRVTPHIIRENGKTSIKLAVNVQDNQQSGGTNTESGSALPPIKQTKINTQAVIDAGQSLLIGGYYYERKEDSDSGVPILKDIPLLGHLFKTTGKRGEIVERLILITPRIVSTSGNAPSRVETIDFSMSPSQSDYRMRSEIDQGTPTPSNNYENRQPVPAPAPAPAQLPVQSQSTEAKTVDAQQDNQQTEQQDATTRQDWEQPANLKAPRSNKWGFKPWGYRQSTNPWRVQP